MAENMGMAGTAGLVPMQPAGRMPMPPPPMASPETMSRPSPGMVDGRSVIASPLADRASGPMMAQQQQAQDAKLIQQIVMPILNRIAERKKETDPKGSSAIYKMIADLVKAVPPVPGPDLSPGGMTRAGGMAGQVGAGMPPPMGSAPPPPVGGTGSPLSGPLGRM